jgi:hypothetical protein
MTVNNQQLDPTNKLRTSAPQALIDTDFEYGTQVSKWENLSTTNLRPYAFATSTVLSTTAVAGGTISAVTATAGSRSVVISTTFTGTFVVGSPIIIQDTLLAIANGVFTVTAVTAGTSITYTARSAATATGDIKDANKTTVTLGQYYTNAAIGSTPTWSYSNALISVTTTVPHGLSIGNEIAVVGTSATTNAPNGIFTVTTVTSPTRFYYQAGPNSTATPTGTITGGLVYTRPQGVVLHRPFDGGVIFSSNGSSNYEATTRQTRRYFRYQSGKGIQISSGTILKPNFQVDSLQYIQSTGLVTVTTKDQHNIQPGSTILISGANEAFFNGLITVYGVTGYNSFTYTPATNPGTDTKASGNYYASITNWYGAVNRLGIFDNQNGLFFEFDGQQLYAVRRSSTYQISGRISVNSGSATVTQTTNFPTVFSKQLVPGDFVVIRGQSYRVDAIASDTSLTISPAYRGADNVVGAIMSKTIDTKVPQSAWNLDVMDGTGPSGYNLDLSRMQMFYIDYSWYGAGFIRWGLRGTDGDVTYVHKMANNNVNFEAYMRSGNLPGRYESATIPPLTTLAASVTATDSSITVADTSAFPPSGTILIKNATNYEHVNYSGKTKTSFTGLTRARGGLNSAGGITTALGSNVITSISAANSVQIGMRVISLTPNAFFPDGTFVTGISADKLTITVSQALTGSTTATGALFSPMGAISGQAHSYSVTSPISIELAFPTFAPTISHWGTSVIMDGRFDDDKSLLFTYGQTATTGLGATNPLSIGTTNVTSSGAIITAPSGTQNVVVGQALAITGGTGVLQGSATASIGAQTPTGTTDITITTASHTFVAGQNVVISGVTPSGYNGTWPAVAGTTGTTLIVTIGYNPGTITAGGSAVGQTVVTAVNSTTTFTVSPAPSTPLTAASVTVSGASQKALFAIRIAPSVDNGKAAQFGQRDLINRMQLVLRTLDIALQGSTFGNLLVTAVLNGVSSTATAWNSLSSPTSSLAQIADFASGGNTTTSGGEVTGGFFVNGTGNTDLALVRDLGNALLGGGTTVSNTGIYPDGPDVLTIVVQNLNTIAAASVVGRLSWTEAQA